MQHTLEDVVLPLGGQLGLVVLEYAASFQEHLSLLGFNLSSVLHLSKCKSIMY